MGSTTVGEDSFSRVMEKPGQDLIQKQALKCPRCDSSNTKFCYYNNYSLSQPRHFCKACKRYWTRGGTLRNVPVGGGFRKNKRVKRHTSSSTTTSPPPSPTLNHSSNSNLNHPTNSNINPLFYGLPSSRNSTCEVINNLPFPGFSFARASSNSGYDPQSHRMNAFGSGGLGFSSGIMSSEGSDENNNGCRNNNNNGGFGISNSNTFLSAYNSIFGFGSSSSSSNCSPTTPVMASLLSSTLLQQNHQGLAPLEESAVVMAAASASKEGKGEGYWNQIDHHHHNNNHVSMSDPSLYGNTASATTALGGAWNDNNQTNIGPSVTSLI